MPDTEINLLKRLETLVRLCQAYPNSVVETRAKQKIPDLLKEIDTLYSHPFDTEAACKEFAFQEMTVKSEEAEYWGAERPHRRW